MQFMNKVTPGMISPALRVPASIVKPVYANTGIPTRGRSTLFLTNDRIEALRDTCRIAKEVLDIAAAAVKEGVTGTEIDFIAHEACIERGAYPSCLNYNGFPKSICVSVNEVICHGIPDSRAFENGDIVNIDVTVFKNGYHGDCSKMVLVGDVDERSRKLVEVAEESLYIGINAIKVGGRIKDIGKAIDSFVQKNGFSVVQAYCGHGIGETFHADPQVPHNFTPEIKYKIKSGMVFTIEPMINMGDWRHKLWEDDWTAVTIDGLPSAQFEHTILVKRDGVEVLTG
jgi:methionyl aminopeptidase